MAYFGDTSASSTLHGAFTRCLGLYRELAFSLLQPTPEASSSLPGKQFDDDSLLDGFGRLKIWGEQTKASLQAGARGSLDDFLRNEEKLNEEAKGMLLQLEVLLDSAVSIASKPLLVDDHGTDSSDLLVSDSDYSSQNEEDESFDNIPPRPKVSRLSMILSHIFEQIQLLYHLGSLFRRPGLKGRYLRRGNWEQSAEAFDLRHIEEKLREWKREARAETGLVHDDPVVSPDDIEARLASRSELDLHSVLSRRFAKANLQRREQLKYWSKHPFREAKKQRPDERNSPLLEEIVVQSATVREYDVPEILDEEASTVKQSSSRQVTEKTKKTVYTFSTVADSGSSPDVEDIPEGAPRPTTIYAESLVAGKRPARVPAPPNPKLSGWFECPYCHTELDAEIMRDRQTWKQHVFRDLRPYTCTFAECSNPDKLYTTRHEWIYHEMQMHRRQWVCHKCQHDGSFESKELFIEHLNHVHSASWSQHQISGILDISDRPTAESAILPCSLCSSELSLSKLLPHLAGHLEEISLFSLPVSIEEDDHADSNKGAARAPSQTEGSRFGDESPRSSLCFSDRPLSERAGPNSGTQIDYPGPLRVTYDISQHIVPEFNAFGVEWGDDTDGPATPASQDEDMAVAMSIPGDDHGPQGRDDYVAAQSASGTTGLGDLGIDVNKLDVDRIIRYLHEECTSSFADGQGVNARLWLPLAVITLSEIQQLITKATHILLSQPVLLELDAPVKIFGELDGSVHMLMRYFEHQDRPQESPQHRPPWTRYLFLGGYLSMHNVHSFDALLLLLAHKVKHPQSVFLLRGEGLSYPLEIGGPPVTAFQSHIEGFLRRLVVRTEVRFETELSTLAASILSSIQTCFCCLPMAAMIERKVFAIHHGLTPNPAIWGRLLVAKRPFTLERMQTQLTAAPKTPEGEVLSLINSKFDELVNSSDNVDGWSEEIAGLRRFGPNAVLKFLRDNNLNYMCTSLGLGEEQFSRRNGCAPLEGRYIGVHGVSSNPFHQPTRYSTTLTIEQDLKCLEQKWEYSVDDTTKGPLPDFHRLV